MKKTKGNFDLLLKMKQKKNKSNKKSKVKEKDKSKNIDELGYRELQDLAQENDIQANQKKQELIKQLKEVL